MTNSTRTTTGVLDAHRAAGQTFIAGGVQSFMRAEGDGETVVCIHGMLGSSFGYRKVLRELAGRGLRGIAWDLPGFGLAERPLKFDYSWTGLGRFCAAAVDTLNIDTLNADTLNGQRSELAGFAADSCVCLNVLEHIADDVAALRAMSSVLIPGGVIVLLVPAFPSLYGPIDRNLGHYRRYTLDSLTRLAAETGLRVRKTHYVNCAGFFGWWLNSRILKREAQSEKQIAAFDTLVPALSRLEEIAHPPFGQSLFVMLQKPC